MAFYRKILMLTWAAFGLSCASMPNQMAHQLAREMLIIDTHIDVPYRLYRNPADVGTATESGDFDYPRARAGGLDAPFMSIYIPADVDEAGGAEQLANELIDATEAIVAAHPGKYALATCVADIKRNFDSGLISLPLGMENGAPISNDFNKLAHFYKRGIRYVTLTHSRPNHISDSSYASERQWHGLSPFGQSLIAEMNRTGVMIDVSHISDEAFWQVVEQSATPVIASHSSLRHFTPGWERNMSDAMVTALAARGGVIQISFGSIFISGAPREWNAALAEAATQYRLANHLQTDDPKVVEFMRRYRTEHPYPRATLDAVLDHFDRVVAIAGIDAVGIGSDYDGVGDSLPTGLEDVSTYPNLIHGLMERGYDKSAIEKILSGNLLRVWQAVEDYATNQGNPPSCAHS